MDRDNYRINPMKIHKKIIFFFELEIWVIFSPALLSKQEEIWEKWHNSCQLTIKSKNLRRNVFEYELEAHNLKTKLNSEKY